MQKRIFANNIHAKQISTSVKAPQKIVYFVAPLKINDKLEFYEINLEFILVSNLTSGIFHMNIE